MKNLPNYKLSIDDDCTCDLNSPCECSTVFETSLVANPASGKVFAAFSSVPKLDEALKAKNDKLSKLKEIEATNKLLIERVKQLEKANSLLEKEAEVRSIMNHQFSEVLNSVLIVKDESSDKLSTYINKYKPVRR